MQADKPSDTEIVLTRRFAASRETLFAALTEPERLSHWLKATGMTLVSCEVDLRVGGTFRQVFRRPGGRTIEVRGTYRAVAPPRGFVYEESYDFSPLRLLVATELEEATRGRTLLTQTLTYASKPERDADYDGVATSSAEAYAELERYLAAMSR